MVFDFALLFSFSSETVLSMSAFAVNVYVPTWRYGEAKSCMVVPGKSDGVASLHEFPAPLSARTEGSDVAVPMLETVVMTFTVPSVGLEGEKVMPDTVRSAFLGTLTTPPVIEELLEFVLFVVLGLIRH